MSFTSELVQAGIKGISKKAAKFLNGMPVQDIAPTIKAVTRNPNEVADMLKHVENVANGDQSGILPYVQYQNKFSNEDVADLRNSQTLTHGVNKGSANQEKLYSWVGDRKSSELSQAGMRRNVMQYGYNKRLQDPDIPPSEISQGFKEEMGTITYGGEPQKVVSGGSKPTKKTDISEAGQRKLQVQAVAENQARKDRGVVKRKRHESTSVYTKMKADAAKLNSQALKDAKTQGMRTTKGQQFVSVEHDVAITHASKYWDKVGYIGNEADNIFIQPNQLARQFKDNIENWFYPKSKDFVIKSNRSNLKDLIIVNIDTGQEVLRIPMPADFKTGIPDNIIQQLNKLIGK